MKNRPESLPEERRSFGYVYFIAPEALLHRHPSDQGRVVKIGYTSGKPFARLQALQTGSPLPLKLWAYIEGGPDLEAAFHQVFAELRIHGEWFTVNGRLADFLGYLGDEPNTGRLIPFADLEAAVFDNIFCELAPPEADEHLWKLSANGEPLARYFPAAWQEALL